MMRCPSSSSPSQDSGQTALSHWPGPEFINEKVMKNWGIASLKMKLVLMIKMIVFNLREDWTYIIKKIQPH